MNRTLSRVVLCRVAIATGLMLASSSSVRGDELRTWTDSTGKFKIEAKLSAVEEGKAVLVQADGTEIEIPLAKLSKADQDYIKAQDADNPFKPKTENPFAPKAMPTPATPAATGTQGVVDDSGAFESRLATPNLTGVQTLSLLNTGEGWKLDPASLAGTPVNSPAGKPFSLPPKTGFHEKCTGVVINAAGTHAAIGYKLDFPRETAQTRIVIVDLQSGKATANRTTGGQLRIKDLADDGQTLIVCRDEFGFGKSDRLEVWTVTSAQIRKGIAWHPFDDAKGGDRDVLLAEFSADGRLVTASAGGRVIAWTLEPLTAVWSAASVGGCRPALSPDRKHLLLADKEQLCVIELAVPQVIASRAAPKGAFPKIAFSPDATRFAVMSQSGGAVFETSTGEQYREIEPATLPTLGSPSPAIFANDEQLLVGQEYLVDLPSLIPLWKYEGAATIGGFGGAVWFVAADGERNPGVLFGAKLPHPGVSDALEKALSDPNYFVLKPGGSVSLKLDELPDQKQREEVRTALTARLGEKEIQVADGAPVEVVCRFDPPKDINIVFHGFGGMQAVDFNETVAHVEIRYQGQQLWRTSASNRPFMVPHDRDQSLQDAIRKFETPNYDYFKGVNLPRMLLNPSQGSGRTLGTSRITTTGIR